MAALVHPHPAPHRHRGPLARPVADFFALEAAGAEREGNALSGPAGRPHLRVIPGGPEAALRRRQPAHVYRARRLAVLGALAVSVVGLVAAVAALAPVGEAAAPPAGEPATVAAPGPSPSLAVAADGTYRVRPGDTLWSLALAIDPSGDVRPLVDELADRAGPGALQAGATIDLSGLVATPAAG